MNQFTSFLSKNKPGLLMGFGLGSMIVATITGIAGAPMARDALEAKKEELNVDKLSPMDTILTAGPYFLPPVLFTCVGVGCILGGNQMNLDRGAAAMAAYAISDATFREYREKTKEIVGEKKEKDIKEAAAKELMDKNPLAGREVIITGKGDTLCFEKISGRYFRSDIETLRRIENRLNKRMITESFISLNELYLEMGLDAIELGDELGWHIDRGYIGMQFSAQLTDVGDPCLVVDFDVMPRYRV